MKNIKFILVFLILTSSLISCVSDGGTSKIKLRVGAVPNFVKSTNLDGFINLNELNLGNDVQIGFDLNIAQGDVSSADIIGFYKTSTGTYGPVTLFSDLTTFPATFDLNADDIVSAFSELTSKDDLQLADQLIITAKLTLKDGTILPILNDDSSNSYGSDVSSSSIYSVKISYPVSCPSDLGGVYNVISNGDNTDGQPAAVNLPYTVTVTDNGGGSYTISDGVAGIYIFWYSIYGYTFETSGNFTDVCGTLTGSWTESFGCTVDLTGTVNGDGTLSIHWDNCFGDFADAIYTPQ